MSKFTRLLARVVSSALLSGLAIGAAQAQQGAIRSSSRSTDAGQRHALEQELRQMSAVDPRYSALKTRLVNTSSARQTVTSVPHVAPARPACFEPFDTTATGGWTMVPREDDNSSPAISLGWDFSLFGTRYSTVYVNTNGNITFNAPLNSFNAQGFPISTPMVAAFWADVDTRNPASGSVWYKVFPDRFVVTWNRVGYYNSQGDKKNTFQLTIKANTAANFTGNDVIIAYDDMQWTTGSASSGVNGFGGIPATVGANRGNSVDYIQTGRFNIDSNQAPNNPNAGDPGGISWLDGQCLGYQVRAVGNTPPAVAGFPGSNTITVNQGQTVTLPLQFSGPETNQTVSVTTNLNGLCNATAPVTGNGGTNPNLTFSVTGAACNVGTTAVTFTATDNGLPSPAQSVFTLNVVVNPPVANGQWTGAVSTVYTNPANWSSNVVPTASDDVSIPAGVPNMPVLSSSAAARSFAVASGASLTVASGGTLSLGGNLTNNGTISGAGTLATTGASAQTISGASAVSMDNVTVGAAGLQLGAGLRVGRVLTLNGNLTSNGNLTLLSNATSTAMVVNNGSAIVSGTATVQRYIDPSRNAGPGYRHLAAPVSNTTLADLAAAGFSPVVNPAYNGAANPGTVTPFPNIFSYNQGAVVSTGNGAIADFDKGWVSPGSTGDAMVAGRGYTVNLPGGQTMDFVGTLGNGGVTLSGLGRSNEAQAGWHLVGNPYPAPIDWNQVFANSTGLENAVHVYKSTGQYTGSYASYVNGASVNGGTNIIPLGQAFFVRASTAGTAASVSMSNAVRTTTYSNVALQRTQSTETRTLLQLGLSGAGATDQLAVYFQSGATLGFDRAFDAPKLSAGNNVLLALDEPTGALAINGLPLLGNTPVTLPLVVRVAQTGTYTLHVDQLLNLPAGATVQLRDALTGTTTALSAQATYSFSADASLAGPRFSLIFNAARPTAAASAQLSAQVAAFPNPAHEQLWVSVPVGQQPVQVVLINALGQQVLRRVLPATRGAQAQALSLHGLAHGVYSLQVALPEGVVTKRIVLE